MYALDTNTVIYFFKGMGAVMGKLLSIPPSSVAIPAVVLFELENGIAQSSQPGRRRAQLDLLLNTITVLAFDAGAAREAAAADALLRRAGSPIEPMDTLIAGTALAHGATLVTRNVSEFRRIRGLRVEDWF